MKILFLISSFFSVVSSAAIPPDAQILNGRWESTQIEDFPKGFRKRIYEIAYPKVVLTGQRFTGKTNGKLYWEQKYEGKILSVKRFPANNRILSIDIEIEKNTIFVKGPLPQDIKAGTKGCLENTLRLDVFKNGCGILADQRGLKRIYLNILPLDKSTLLFGVWSPTPKTEALRTRSLNVYPLVKR